MIIKIRPTGENEEDRYKDVNKSENNDSINLSTDRHREIARQHSILQWTEFLNNILKLDLTFKFSTVSNLNICALHIIGKTL